MGWLLVAQLAVVASGPDTATVCDTIRISVAAQADGVVAPTVSLPLGRGIQLLRTTLSTRIEPEGTGKTVAFTEASYLVAITAGGRIVIPGAVATLGARRAIAAPIRIDLHADESPAPVVLVRSSLDDGRGRGPVDSLYVGQQMDYVVDVQLNETARQRMRRNPTFFPPEMPAVLAYDLPAPAPVQRGGPRCFESLSYHRALFPLFPGSTTIPPATLSYGLPVSMSFFSREERFEQRTDSVSFRAVEPPAAGRPPDYAGAVGALRASTRLGTAPPRMGDPLILTLRVAGRGNVKLLPRPTLALSWASIAQGEERVDVDTTQMRVQGSKEFDWLLTPRVAGHQEVPVIRYPYFDPERAAYDVTSTDSISLDVAAASLAAVDTAVAPGSSGLSVRTTLRDELPPTLPTRPWYWMLLAAAPVPAALRRVVRRRARRADGVSASRRLQQIAGSRSTPPPRELRRLYLDALRERVPMLTLATVQAPLARQLRRAGVTEATAIVAEELLGRLDRAAFAASGDSEAKLATEAAAVVQAVDTEAVRPRAGAGRVVVILAGAVLLGGALRAMPADASRSFDDGVRAYAKHQAVVAERLFAGAAVRAPRSADSWANFGTAAWSANDSARAALGWQRALRLEPLDAETRERLAGIGPTSFDSAGYVPPVPVDALAIVALALWIAAWLALALPPAQRPAWVRPLGGGAVVVAIVTLLSAVEVDRRLDARGLAVLRGATTLLDDPSPTATAAAAGTVGEVARLGPREGEWIRVTLDGGRAGWIPVRAMIPLDSGSPAD